MQPENDNGFAALLKRLIRVPKHEIDEQEEKYREEREESVDKRTPIVPAVPPRQ